MPSVLGFFFTMGRVEGAASDSALSSKSAYGLNGSLAARLTGGADVERPCDWRLRRGGEWWLEEYLSDGRAAAVVLKGVTMLTNSSAKDAAP